MLRGPRPGSGFGVLWFSRAVTWIPITPPPLLGFSAQGKMVGSGESNSPYLLSPLPGAEEGACSGLGHKGGGWAFPAHRACPFSSPGLGWNYTSPLSWRAVRGRVGGGRDPCPFPWWPPGSQHISQAPASPGPGALLGDAEIICLRLRSGKSLCEKPPEGPSGRNVAQSGE